LRRYVFLDLVWIVADLLQFPESPLVHKPTLTNGTFLQFFFKADKLAEILIPCILARKETYGLNKFLGLKDPKDPSKGPKKMIVEFSSPNIAKPFHAGHLRSTIIGGFLANLYEGAGWDVVRINYLGDWGKQYGILAIGFEKYGNEEALQKNPINHLFEVYVKINKDKDVEEKHIEEQKAAGQDITKLREESIDERARKYFKAMTDNEPNAIAQWSRFRELSIKGYKQTYARLNIHFDEYSGESQVPQKRMDAMAQKMEDMGISEPSDGAVIVDFTKHVPGKAGKSLGKTLIKRKDGTALYLTRDISEIQQREDKYNFDHMIYVVASAQDLHLQQLFKIVELMGYKELASKVQHINFGLVLGMSTRKGTVKFLDDILEEVGEAMHEVMRKNQDKYAQVSNPEATADILGITSVMVQDMSGKRYFPFCPPIFPKLMQIQNQQLQLRHRSHDLLRRRHRTLPPIRARPSLLHLPPRPRSPLLPHTRRNRYRRPLPPQRAASCQTHPSHFAVSGCGPEYAQDVGAYDRDDVFV